MTIYNALLLAAANRIALFFFNNVLHFAMQWNKAMQQLLPMRATSITATCYQPEDRNIVNMQ
jgi:hypothetical protein